MSSDFMLSERQIEEFDVLQNVMQRYAVWVSAGCLVGFVSWLTSSLGSTLEVCLLQPTVCTHCVGLAMLSKL